MAVIAVPATLSYIHLRQQSANGSDVTLGPGRFELTVPRDRFLSVSIFDAAWLTSHSIQALNLPAFSVELLVDRSTRAWPSTWTPSGMDFFTWRALVFPIYCLPFWYFVGLGLESLSGRRKLKWPALLLGTLLWGFFLFLVLGLRFGLSAEDRGDIVYAFWGFYLWVVLFSVFPIAWVRQRRTKLVA